MCRFYMLLLQVKYTCVDTFTPALISSCFVMPVMWCAFSLCMPVLSAPHSIHRPFISIRHSDRLVISEVLP